jgi:predicted ATPase/class 3 adenylate cyclase
MAELPTGTVTFLFTDVEGSTRLWETAPGSMGKALELHDSILRDRIRANNGHVFSTGGDGFAAAFARAGEALDAAVSAQKALASEPWPEDARLKVRMGLHTGEAEEREGNYYGPVLNQTARLMALGHGGQILCSAATAELLDDAGLTELGEHRLRDLSAPAHVFQVGADTFPPLRSVENFPGNLPLLVSSFVGRDRELARVADATTESRVVTLTGVGGVGKTRLALQVAAEMLPRFKDGAWLVELAPLRDPEGVAGAVAAVFGVTPQLELSLEQALVEFMRTKELLLILDNCEHLLDAVGDLVEALGRSCPGLVVLLTSREGLALDGERVVPVPSLSEPPAGASLAAVAASDAVSLFVERAALVDPDFALTEDVAPPVAQICRRLDGVPLAIELAAARVATMTPAELAGRLDRRFETLAGRRRRAVERHQTLRAAIDWSYELCTEEERRLLGRVAVFVGGWSRPAAEAVCAGEPIARGHVFDLLAGLVTKSLVVAHRDGPETRYRLLETIREYAEERLAEWGETETVRDAHARYYLEEAALQRRKSGPDQPAALRFYRFEEENLFAALEHAVETGDVGLGLSLVRTFHWPSGGAAVGYRPQISLLLAALLRLPGASEQPPYPFALARMALVASLRGDQLEAEAGCERALAAADRSGPEIQHEVENLVVGIRLFVAWGQGRWREAAEYAERGVALVRASGEADALWLKLNMAATAYLADAQPDVALPLASESLELARQRGAPMDVALSEVAVAAALAPHEPERARKLLHEGLDRLKEFGPLNEIFVAWVMWAAAWTRDWPLALELAPRAIQQLYGVNDRIHLAQVFNFVARAIAPTDQEAPAVLLGSARSLGMETVPMPTFGDEDQTSSGADSAAGPVPFLAEIQQETIALLHAGAGEARLRELLARGESMDVDQAVAAALDAIARNQVAT